MGNLVMVLALVVLFLAVILVLFVHLYAKWFWYRGEEEAATATTTSTHAVRRRRRLEFATGHMESQNGLDPSVLKSLPVKIFYPKDFKDGLECAVCLSDLADGEKARLLPKCNHGFHVDCIDMWFQSHSTCPLCRNPVSNSTQSPSVPNLTLESILQPQIADNSTESSPNFPTNVLFWGNQTQVSTLGSCLDEERQIPTSSQPTSSSSTSSSSSPSSSSSSSSNRADGIVIIDMPRQIAEDEEPKSPVTTRLRSLKRLLSRERRVNPCMPSVDPEQVGRSQS